MITTSYHHYSLVVVVVEGGENHIQIASIPTPPQLDVDV